VPLPSFDEQRRIVRYIDGLHAKMAQACHYQESTQAELDALLPAILDKAFWGEL
jgi:type I restriction enzyme S subunit